MCQDSGKNSSISYVKKVSSKIKIHLLELLKLKYSVVLIGLISCPKEFIIRPENNVRNILTFQPFRPWYGNNFRLCKKNE